jgi:hypothetical protein
MSYPLAAEVVDLTRELLLADSLGAEFVYPDNRILRVVSVAWREMWDALAQFGAQRPRATYYHLLPAYTNVICPARESVFQVLEPIKVEEDQITSAVDISEISEAGSGEVLVTTAASHGLSSNSRVVVTGANQDTDGDWFVTVTGATQLRLNGSVFRSAVTLGAPRLIVPSSAAMTGFTAVVPVTVWTRKAPAATLREYQWQTDRFRFHGATAQRLLSIAAILAAPPAPTARFDLLAVDNCQNFLAYRTAGLLAGAQGRDDLFTRYSVMALGPNQKPDGSGGYLAGLTTVAARSSQRTQTQRPTP